MPETNPETALPPICCGGDSKACQGNPCVVERERREQARPEAVLVARPDAAPLVPRYWKVQAKPGSGVAGAQVHAPDRDRALQEAARMLAGGTPLVQISRGPVEHECRNARFDFDTREWKCVKCGELIHVNQ